MKVMRAEEKDLNLILELQYRAYRSEALLVNNFSIQPMVQSLSEMREEFRHGVFYKAVDDFYTIIGSVRGQVRGGSLFIGKLMVEPDFQGKGIGTLLLKAIEDEHPGLRKELFTSNLSKNNIRLYEKSGYSQFKSEPAHGGFQMVYLQK